MVNYDKRIWDSQYARLSLAVGLVILLITGVLYLYNSFNNTIDSYELTEMFEDGKDVAGQSVEIVVHNKGSNPTVGEFLWDEREDVSYVTFDEVNLDNVGIGDTVIVTVDDILDLGFVYMVQIEDAEVIGQ